MTDGSRWQCLIIKYYENLPSITKIEKNLGYLQLHNSVKVIYLTATDTNKLLRNINIKKAARANKIPPKVVISPCHFHSPHDHSEIYLELCIWNA